MSALVTPHVMVVACQIGHGGGRQGGGALLKGAARLELLAEYYNGRIALWEPVLEKVGAGVGPPSFACQAADSSSAGLS